MLYLLLLIAIAWLVLCALLHTKPVQKALYISRTHHRIRHPNVVLNDPDSGGATEEVTVRFVIPDAGRVSRIEHDESANFGLLSAFDLDENIAALRRVDKVSLPPGVRIRKHIYATGIAAEMALDLLEHADVVTLEMPYESLAERLCEDMGKMWPYVAGTPGHDTMNLAARKSVLSTVPPQKLHAVFYSSIDKEGKEGARHRVFHSHTGIHGVGVPVQEHGNTSFEFHGVDQNGEPMFNVLH